MSGADWVAGILLVVAVVTVAISALGVLLAKDFYERLHYMAPAATVGAACVAAAVLVKESLNQAGIKAVFIAGVLFLINSALTHATARAGRVEQYGKLDVRPEERQRGPRRDAA